MWYLAVISVAIIVSGRKIIFGNIFAQTGFPARESFVNVVTVVSNFALNIVLILGFGLLGAAVATAVSYLIYGYTLRYYTKKELKITI